MATDLACVLKIIKERSNGNVFPGWKQVIWVSQNNPAWVTDKINIGFLNDQPVYAHFSPYTNDPNKNLRICHGPSTHEITTDAFGNINFLNPFRAIEEYPIAEPTRRYILRVVLRACFILKGHTKDAPADMKKSFRDSFRRGIGFIMESMGGAPANGVKGIRASNEEGVNIRIGKPPAGGSSDAFTDPYSLAAATDVYPPKKNLPSSSFHQQVPPTSASTKALGFTFTDDCSFSSLGGPKPHSAHHTMSHNSRTIGDTSSDSDVSQAYEDNEIPPDAEDAPKRGWNSVNKRLANQTVTPSKRRFGMFEEMTTSPSGHYSGPLSTPRKTSQAIPRKRLLDTGDNMNRDKSVSPKSVRKSPTAKNKAGPDALSPGSQQVRSIRLGSPLDETELVSNDDDPFTSGKKDAAANAAKVISNAAIRATNKEQQRMSEMFAGGNGTKPGGTYPTQSGKKTTAASTPNKQKAAPFKPTKSPATNLGPSSSKPGADDDLFKDMTPERKTQVLEILRFEDILNSARTNALSHQKSIERFNTCHEQACRRLDDVNDKIERETSGTVKAWDEANKRDRDEIARLQGEIQRRSQNGEKQLADLKKEHETSKLNAERDIEEAKGKTASKNDELAKENEKRIAAEKGLEEIWNQCAPKDIFGLGKDVGEYLARKKQRRS